MQQSDRSAGPFADGDHEPAPRAGTFEWDRRAGTVTWSPALAQLHGLSESFRGTLDEALADAHPDDRERVATAIRDALEQPQRLFNVEYRIVRPDGSVRWLEAHGEVLIAGDGEPVGIRGVCADASPGQAMTLLEHVTSAVNRTMVPAIDLDAGLEQALAALGEALDGEVVIYRVTDLAGRALQPQSAWGRSAAAHELAERSPQMLERAEGLAGRAWQDRAPVWVGEFEAEEPGRQRDWALAGGLRCGFAFPIDDVGGLRGVIEWFGRTPFAADPYVSHILRVITSDVRQVARRLSAEARGRARERQQAAVARLGRLALEGVALPVLFDEAVSQLATTLDVEFAKILQLLPNRRELLLVAGVGWDEGLVGHRRVGAGAGSQGGFALATDAPVIVRDLRSERRFTSTLLSDHGVISGLSIAIHGSDGAWGVLGAHTAREREFTPDDTAFLESVSNVLATAIERDHGERERTFLLHASATLLGSLDYRETLRALAALAVEAVADWCAIHVIEDGGGHVFETAHRDPGRLDLVRRYRAGLASEEPPPALMQVIRTGETRLVSDVDETVIRNSTLPPEGMELLRALDIRSVIIAPLTARGRVLGAITLASAESLRRYTDADAETATELARRAALAIDNARLYEQTREALQTREDFVSLASHELRGPLTSILGFAGVLRRRSGQGDFDEATGRILTTIDAEAHRMRDTLTLFLDMAMLDTGRFTVEVADTDLAELVSREASLIQLRSPGAEIEVRRPPDALPARTDPTRVRMILANLLANAVKYGGDPARVVVAVSDSERTVTIRVRDNGTGIAAADREHVFERYYRGTGGQHREPGGLGIGLYISRQIADRLGASLWFETEHGEGTEFILTLPRGEPKGDRGGRTD